ncbi:MAG: helix-turn-helix domain-containing protein [Candidatus Harrisonbacteria bacterium]|nr:helix-turn-helix domain-containing protein [Candidatus Harrisonbacteria bacterium]
MENKEFISTVELAQILGISRQAVADKIKHGKIKAQKSGRVYVIQRKDIPEILGEVLTESDKKEIEVAVKKTVREYGETLRLLGKE